MSNPHRSSTHSRSSSHSRGSLSHQLESDNEEDVQLHSDLFERAVAASSQRNQRSRRASMASLHDLELMQAIDNNNTRNPSEAILPAFDATAEEDEDEEDEDEEEGVTARRNTGTSTGTHTSTAHLRFGQHSGAGLDASVVSHGSAASAYSEYSEYEEDEFDPEWHARQNQQAAMALLVQSGQHQAAERATENTRSILSFGDVESQADQVGSQLFANRRDLREEVDQSVNLMDASTGNYDDPREYGELLPGRRTSRQNRRGKKPPPNQGILAAAQHTLVDVILDGSDGKLASFRRSLSRGGGEGNMASFRRSLSRDSDGPNGTGSHQRRLFYGHDPSPRPTFSESGENCFSLENCCKVVIILFVATFVVILATPQALWWIQEKLGLINDNGDPLIPTPSAPENSLPVPTLPFVTEDDARLAALHKMILTHKLTSKDDLLNKDTPQYKASHWLANHDPANLTLLLNDGDGWGIIEPHKVLNRYAMATFYLAMDGPRRDEDTNKLLWNETNWHTNEGWMSEKHICDWYGIECEGQIHIEHFNLTNNRLKGTIPSELSVLTDLILVDWSVNGVTGPLPDFVGEKWRNLEYLLLSKNDFQGTLPPSIGNLTKLEELILTHTNLKGSIPTEINQLTELRVFKMDHNNFDGSIPPLGNLASLEYLVCYSNFLTGSLPESIYQLTNLVALELGHNYLKGTIASEVENLHKLEAFTVGNNELTGFLPDVWNQAQNLVEFEVDNNHIRGSIPSSLAVLTNLQYLTLDDNGLTGTIPSQFGNLESLVVLKTYHTQLAGSMPKEVCALEAQRGVDMIMFGDCEDGRFHCECCDRCF